MADWDDVLGDLDGPRPLGPELRARLEEQLVSDGVPAALASADLPRPLSADLRARLLAELAPARAVPAWRRPGTLAAAAAAVVAAVTAAVLLQPDDRPRPQVVTAQPTTGLPSLPPAVVLDGTGTAGSEALRPTSAPGRVVAPKPTPAASTAAPRSADHQVGGPAVAPAAGSPPPVAAERSAPTLTSLAPSSGPFSGGTVVTVTGTGFTSDAVVVFGGTRAASVEVVSSTTLRATTPAHLPGVVDVTVTVRRATSNALPFRYVA